MTRTMRELSFSRFQSLCADCGRPVPAAYTRRGDRVYLEKACPEHGLSRVLASEDAELFERWLAFPTVSVPPRLFVTKGQEGAELGADINNTECPLHCGVCENHLMTACCVLLNVTERCNQHCPYCFANAGEDAGAGDCTGQDPTLAEIESWLDRLTELGEERKFNIQLSGGEPTVRADLPDIIRMCKTKGFEYVQLNTNGKRLGQDAAYAKELNAAGLSAVFLQFDGVDDAVYLALRGEPLLDVKKAAVRHCGMAGLPVTLVPTVLKNTNLTQTGAMVDFMLDHINVVKGVHFQPASFFGRRPDERGAEGDFDERVTMFAIMNELEKQTGGRIRKSDLAPISTGHPLCCFCASFMKERNGDIRRLSSGGSCCETADGISGGGPRCGEATALSVLSCSCAEPDALEIIRRDRDFVLNKWRVSAPDEPDLSALQDADGPVMSFDEAIAMFKSNMFTISGMAFMDETNLDAERLCRCRVQVFTQDERLVPFCGYYAGPRQAGPKTANSLTKRT